MYKLLRTILFFFPAEAVHHFSMKGLRLLCSWGPTRRLVCWGCRPEGEHSRKLLGLNFRNSVGLGAGFDKNALYLRELDTLGFGFVEIGTVTPKPQAGNEQPRLFRLPQDQALINRMGFNNDGVEAVAERLRQWRQIQRDRKIASALKQNHDGYPMIIGGNLGKNKTTPNEEAWKDYEICFRALYQYVDYFIVNVSSPNTPGLRQLQDKDSLRQILTNLQRVNTELSAGLVSRPLLLKIAPDLNQQQLDDVIALALEIGLDGLVATNTTISREGLLTSAERIEAIGAGGLSGAPLRERSTEVVRYLADQAAVGRSATDQSATSQSVTNGSATDRSGGRLTIMASGGIFTAADARQKIDAGASLVQVWTGFIYEGPFIVGRICRGLTTNTPPSDR